MQAQGVIDRSVRFTPALEGLAEPEYVHWLLASFTDFPVQSLDDLSSRDNMGRRCFERLLLCSPQSWFKPDAPDGWVEARHFADLGQHLVNFHKKDLPRLEKDPKAYKVVFLERSTKRRILNMRQALASCRGWKPPAHSGFTHTDCGVLNVDDGRHWKVILAIMNTVDVMVGVHGAGLTYHNFQRPGSALVEVFPCHFHQDAYFQQTSRREATVMPFQVLLNNTLLCQPGAQEANADQQELEFVEAWVPKSLARDQDIKLDMTAVLDCFARHLALSGSSEAYLKALQEKGNFSTLVATLQPS